MVVLMRPGKWLPLLAACAVFGSTGSSPFGQERQVVSILAERFTFAPSKITVPVGVTLELRVRSNDTAHGFHIVGQGVNVAVPKRRRGEAVVLFDAAQPGRYRFECSRMCGADAYRNEMGITNDVFPTELTFDLTDEQIRRCDAVTDPEDIPAPGTRRRGIDNFEAFMRLLAPPARGPLSEQVALGRRAFESSGCAACHVPALATGASANALFDRRPVPLFSDLLLHDIGTGDGIAQAGAGPDEIRTPALWGLRHRRPLLHDGSAPTLLEAVLRHDNESRGARSRLLALSDGELAALMAFLESL